MISVKDILPPISNTHWDREFEDQLRRNSNEKTVVALKSAPPYGHRKSWLPRSQEDFGDGGAYPECPIVQYPLDIGKSKESKGSNNTLAVQLDDQGKIKYDVLARQGHSKDKIVYSKLNDMLPSVMNEENDAELQRPSEDEINDTTEKTRQALEKLTQRKISAAMPVRCAEKSAPAQYIRYTPSQQGLSYNSGAQQRVIRMVDAPSDPMEPPKFKINKKVPRGPPSPPAPVMHSPTRKITAKEQAEWRIPPCISNWKNQKGYTIPLDKRLAADGRGLQPVHINEKFAKLAEALYIADRKAREQIEMRSQLEKKLAQKEKVRKEESLKMLAKKAREEHAGLRTTGVKSDDAEKEREKLRQDRARERKREEQLANARGEKGGRLANRERDITEQIALGLPQKTTTGGEAQFDSRLFNQSRGMDSGFNDDEAYNVYDKAWRDSGAGAMASNIYRPSRGIDSETYGAEVEKMMATNRFVGEDAGNSGAGRTGPVQFQSLNEEKDDDDLFGVINLLSEAKNTGKRPVNEQRGGDRREDRDRKRRRDRRD